MSVPPAVSAAQRSVLYAVRRRGEATVADIAECLDMTPSAAPASTSPGSSRLGSAGGRGRRPAGAGPDGPGRAGLPARAGGRGAVPAGLRRADEPAARLPARRRRGRGLRPPARPAHRRRPRPAGAASGGSGQGRRAGRILDEDGYFASVEPLRGGGFRVAEHNCAIFAVAGEHPQACSTELEFIRAVLPEARVERVTHMIAGAHACSYEIRPT